MKYQFLKLICSVTTIFCFSQSSIAALVDFTDRSQTDTFFSVSNGWGGTIDGVGFTLTSTDGDVNFAEMYDGTAGCGGLACNQDGTGITNDEITGAVNGSGGQMLTLSFDSLVNINRFDFLDLYVNPNGSGDKEQATITFDGVFFDTVDAIASVGDGGYASFLMTTPTLVQTIEFTAAAGSDFWDDHNNDYALAAVDVSPVPLPSAIWLFGTGMIGLAGMRRRIKK